MNTEHKMASKLFVDGASRGNPGPSGAGIYLECGLDNSVKRGYYLGKKTNNEAEYLALLIGLFVAKKYSNTSLMYVYSDSLLLVKQMQGEYRVKKPELQKLYALVKDASASLTCIFTHVFREQNQEADRLANYGVDKKIMLPDSFISLLKTYEIYI